jgi:hypothetical protein
LGVGVTGSWQATISVVAKCNGVNAPYYVPNELICAEIGRFIRLPIPPCGIIDAPKAQVKTWFASLDFNLAGNSLPPVDTAKCLTNLPFLSAGLLLFDILIGNSDRHRSNFAVDFSVAPPRMSIFDHSHALLGFQSNMADARLRDLKERLAITGGPHTKGNRHCLLDAVPGDDHFREWLERIGSIPDFLIVDLCHDASELGATQAEADLAADFLKSRRDNMKKIIEDHRGEFRAIRQWSLI